MSFSPPPTRLIGAAAAAALLAAMAPAQTPPPPAPAGSSTPAPPPPPPIEPSGPPDVRVARTKAFTFDVTAGFEHQFDATIDRGGQIEANRFTGVITAAGDIVRDEVNLSTTFVYRFDDYTFETPTGTFAMNPPWEDVHTFALTARATFTLNDEWSIFAGPYVQCSRESGTDLDEGWTGGGFGGVIARPFDGLVIGGGFGILTQLQDDLRFDPMIILDWEITDEFALRSIGTAGGRRAGVEFTWDLGGGWEMGVGGAYRFERFRLDDSGAAPNGVGEETNYPFWARITYSTGTVTMSGFFGWTFQGEIEVEERNGNILGNENYESVPAVGFSASIQF